MLTSVRIVARAVAEFSRRGGGQMGAALAYYSLFSMAPLLVIAISIAGQVLGEERARASALAVLQAYMGPEAAGAVEGILTNARKPNREGGWQTAVAVVILLLGALNVFLQLRASLCRIWELEPPGDRSYLGVLVNYFLATLMVLVVGVLLLASVAVSALLSLSRQVVRAGPVGDAFPWGAVDLAASFLILTLLLAATYRLMSGRQISWGYVVYGSVITGLLLTAGKALLGYYFAVADIASTFGAGGSLVLFLVWVYYSAQILIFGAELIQARRSRAGWLPR